MIYKPFLHRWHYHTYRKSEGIYKKKQIERISEFIKFVGYKLNIQKTNCTPICQKVTIKNEIKTLSCTIRSRNTKYLGKH